MEEKNDFEFNYSAPTTQERKEIESIRNSYLNPQQKEKTKLDILRSLDWKVKNIPCIWALAIGIIGLLIFGLGMTMILEWSLLVWGIVVCVISCAPIILAYPIYNILTKRMREKYSEEIIKLSEELLNDENK